MNRTQWQWLEAVGARIPGLFASIKAGHAESRHVMGERVINGRTVRLSLVAQVVDPGANPLRSHASADYPSSGVVRPEGMVEPRPRRRSPKRNSRW